jgi:hypothetical protein
MIGPNSSTTDVSPKIPVVRASLMYRSATLGWATTPTINLTTS